jgi:glucose/mannose transport system substrate-binding protein
MKKFVFLMAIVIVCLGIAPPSFATELEVTHWWTSGGEAKAVKVFADAFDATGNKWKDAAIGGGGGVARPVIVSRIIGGDPMDATQLNHGQQARELIEAGLMLDLTELAEKEGWKKFVNPSHLLEACTYEGKIYCVPVNIHSWQWLWLNRKVFLENKLNVPTNWTEFKAAAPKLKKAGVVPLATGDSWNLPGMFGVIQTAIGGPELYRKVLQNKDLEAAKSDEWKSIWNELAIVRDQLVDKSWSGRQWNEATAMVISGRAAGQIMGDWAQGEFSVADKVQGKDYDCLPGLGVHELLDAGGDAFYFPKSKDPKKTKAQLQLASLMLSKKVQVKFNLAKGSLPIRGDIDMSTANGCMQKGLRILKNPDQILMSSDVTWSRDTQAQIEDLVVEFFADPNYSVDKVHKKYVKILSAGN